MPSRYVVRYGLIRHVAPFSVKGPQTYARGDSVVVRSDRGMELGEVLCEATERAVKFLPSSETKGHIVRIATLEDEQSSGELHEKERIEFHDCAEMIRERKLQMELIDVEHVLGGERIVFFYLAEKRVDFRELVKALAKKFHTRIEMRQIGVRDEAKLLADYGDCGKPVCCNTHLTQMPPVSMKMAKVQRATLDPTKISGRCGRLKCCLRYEYDTYQEIRRELPAVGNMVVTKQGQGKVLRQEILARKLLIQYEDQRRIIVDESEIVTVVKRSKSAETVKPAE
ncbi:PSP1 domain-containing protein [Symmachiella dynata]|uniref:PSP1 C-terminal domain-containing protein n=1 Tax=Symmachiella dynata TaxID=2527995 RepID=A0A517ZJP8_9PLAN|nr:regulatory iron-sulfur-containing complex subunit RicT [Symmachiella dynata]QDT47199.1 hypothetical protein Pan258_12300 [Symmachiella dynata]QDU42715.1 hypothetical protein Mal52_11820 [Symmachiella dynata]